MRNTSTFYKPTANATVSSKRSLRPENSYAQQEKSKRRIIISDDTVIRELRDQKKQYEFRSCVCDINANFWKRMNTMIVTLLKTADTLYGYKKMNKNNLLSMMPGVIDASQKLYNERNEQILKVLRGIAIDENDKEMIRSTCYDVFEELKNTEVQYKARLIGLRGHIQQMVRSTSDPSRDIRKDCHSVQGNQFTMGGPAACTSISFVSAAIMRQFKQVKEVLMLNWKTIVRDGVFLWKEWMSLQPAGTRGFQTLEQIVTHDIMKPTMERLACRPIEYGGYIDGRLPRHIDEKTRKEFKDIYISLKEAMTKMTKMGRGTVGIVTIGVSSVSMWCSGKNENFIMFDSHGDYVSNSHIYTIIGINRMVEVVTKVCGSGLYVNVGSINATSTYCMYLFEPKKSELNEK